VNSRVLRVGKFKYTTGIFKGSNEVAIVTNLSKNQPKLHFSSAKKIDIFFL